MTWLSGLVIVACVVVAVFMWGRGKRAGIAQQVAAAVAVADSEAYARGQADLKAQLVQSVSVPVNVSVGRSSDDLGQLDHAELTAIAERAHAIQLLSAVASNDRTRADYDDDDDYNRTVAATLAGRGRPAALSKPWGSDDPDCLADGDSVRTRPSPSLIQEA